MPSALTVTFVQATILNAISNILAQLIDQRNNKVRQETHSETMKTNNSRALSLSIYLHWRNFSSMALSLYRLISIGNAPWKRDTRASPRAPSSKMHSVLAG